MVCELRLPPAESLHDSPCSACSRLRGVLCSSAWRGNAWWGAHHLATQKGSGALKEAYLGLLSRRLPEAGSLAGAPLSLQNIKPPGTHVFYLESPSSELFSPVTGHWLAGFTASRSHQQLSCTLELRVPFHRMSNVKSFMDELLWGSTDSDSDSHLALLWFSWD